MDQHLLETLLNTKVRGIMVLKAVRNAEGEVSDFTCRFSNHTANMILADGAYSLEGKMLLDELKHWKPEFTIRFFHIMETGTPQFFEYCWKKKEDKEACLLIEAEKFDDGILMVFHDHSDYKIREVEFVENQEKYKKAETIGHIGHWIVNLRNEKVLWSDNMFRIFGYEPQSFEPTMEFIFSIVHPEDLDLMKENLKRTILTNEEYKNENRFIRNDKTELWIESEAEVTRDQNGEAIKIFGFIHDITARKLRESNLQMNEKLLSSLYSKAGIGIAVVEENGRLSRVNQKLCKLLGYTEEELTQLSYKDFTYPDDLEKDYTLFQQTIEGKIDSYEIEKRYVTRNGNVIWGLLTLSVVRDGNNRFSFAVGMIQDINNRKLAEKKLAESESRFRAIFNSAYQFVGLLTPEGILIEANETALKFAGVTSEEVIGKPFWETKWWEPSEEVREKLREAIRKAASGEFSRFEADHPGIDNSIVTVDFSLTPVKDENGKVILLIPEGKDITEKKKSEKLLRESESRFRLFVTQAPSAIAIFDMHMNYIAVSQKWKDIFNLTENIIGRNHYEVFPEISEEWKQIHREGLSGKVIRRQKDFFRRQDGTTYWVRWELRPWYNIQGEIGGILLFSEDITDDVRNEESILKLNRDLEELNQQKIRMFSVIAHDIKGPVANFTGLLNLIKQQQESLTREEIMEYFKLMEKSAQNVTELLEELLLWSKSQLHTLSFEPVKINVNKRVEKIISQLKPTAESKSIKIVNLLGKNRELQADENMLNTIVRNLISNAIKFTPNGGEVTISEKITEDRAQISVSDTGTGISKENIDKIFDPAGSFTTYGTAGEKGTGLGLKLCLNFVEKHGGRITVESEPGSGSTFSFTMPLSS